MKPLVKKTLTIAGLITVNAVSAMAAVGNFSSLAESISPQLKTTINAIANIVIGILFVVTLFVTIPPVIESAKGTEGANGKVAGVIFRVVVIFLFVFVIKQVALSAL